MSKIKDTFFGGAEKKAAKRQSESADRAIAEQRRAGDEATARLDPFTSIGRDILNPLFDFVIQGPETNFERTAGFEDIQQSAAAGGKLKSGGTLGALTEFNAGVNERFRGNRFNELFRLANLGQSSAAGQANIDVRTGENISSALIGQGDNNAAGIIGAANNTRGTIKDIGSFLATL